MRYMILIAMLMCLPVRGEAWQVVCANGGGCNPAENEIGIRDVGGTNWSRSDSAAVIFRFQADCSGPLNAANIYHNATESTNIKIAVYNSTTTSPSTDTGMSLVGYTGAVSSGGSVGWKSGAVPGGNVVAGNYYWVVAVVSGANWVLVRDATATTYWYNAIDEKTLYAAFPSTLGQSNWSSEGWTRPSIYVSIGN